MYSYSLLQLYTAVVICCSHPTLKLLGDSPTVAGNVYKGKNVNTCPIETFDTPGKWQVVTNTMLYVCTSRCTHSSICGVIEI